MSAIVDTLRATLAAAPDSWQCRLALVEALLAANRSDEAAAVLECVEELPADLGSRVKAGRAYGLLAAESGFIVLDGVLAEDPTCAEAHLERASLCLRIGDIEAARRHYYTATTFKPALSEPELAAALEIPVPASPDQAAVAPPLPGSDAGLSEAAGELAANQQTLCPSPSDLPVISLREALGLKPLRALVDPESIPSLPDLAYDPPRAARLPVHIPEETYRTRLPAVELLPRFSETPVVYRYEAPDDTLFSQRISEEGILVANPLREAAASQDSGSGLDEALKRQRKAQAELIRRMERREKIQSFVAGVGSVAVLCFLMLLVAVSIPRVLPPQIVAAIPDPTQEETIQDDLLRRPELSIEPLVSPASAMSLEMVSVEAFSAMAAPSFETAGLAMGFDGEFSGFGSSLEFGDPGGGETMFFGGRSRGERILFVLDDSRSMTPRMIELRNAELERTLKSLRNVQYHVLIFAGGAYFADSGWGIKGQNSSGIQPTEFKSPRGDYRFTQHSLFDFRLEGDPEDFPAPSWLNATPSNIRRSIKIVNEAPIFGGTDWDTALMLAHLMTPPPDVIFFMSDGRDRDLDVREIIRHSKANGAPVINCVAMMIAEGVEEFSEIARRTGGSYTIVDKDGEPIDGFEYARNPEKFEGRF